MHPASGAPRRPIRVLDPDVANKIAAGEVIERPASVVKELVENSLDAGARRIHVEVRGGGKELIRVSDDGHGLPFAEAPLAFERHATSKITRADDLFAVATLGFRGEALPSIASVARVELVSRVAGEERGVRVEQAGGPPKVSVAGAPVGTSVSVRSLFYNTPARFKFLKSDAAERRHIAEYVTCLALARPDVAFVLVMEGRESLRTPGTGNLAEAVAAVYGREILPELVPVAWDSPAAQVDGFVGKPAIAKGNRSAQCLVVNGRWVQNRMLATALERGFESLLGHRRYPVAVLHLRVDPAAVDVNVHPAKTEIRFREEREVFKAVMLAVRKALTGANLVVDFGPGVEGRAAAGSAQGAAVLGAPAGAPAGASPVGAFRDADGSASADSPYASPATAAGQVHLAWEIPPGPGRRAAREAAPAVEWVGEKRSEWVAPRELGGNGGDRQDDDARGGEHTGLGLAEERAAREAEAMRQALSAQGLDPRQLLSRAVVLGQVLDTYLVVPVPAGMWLIDQHVAHERILYEQVLEAGERGGRTPSQELLVPMPITLSPALAALVEEHREFLDTLGFAVEAFGPRDWVVRAVPASLRGPSPRRLTALLEELGGLLEDGGPTLVERAAAAIACRGAIKAGEPLAPEAMRHLVRSLASVANPFACPHGRPIILQLDRREIERRFGRT